jgi:activator-of-BECN1-regulated-autophagy protein 1
LLLTLARSRPLGAPRQVRFHPRNAALLASGSLDNDVRVWDAVRGVCTASCVFGALPPASPVFAPPPAAPRCAPRSRGRVSAAAGRPIASLAFYPDGELLAVASGHKARAAARFRVTTSALASRRAPRR